MEEERQRGTPATRCWWEQAIDFEAILEELLRVGTPPPIIEQPPAFWRPVERERERERDLVLPVT